MALLEDRRGWLWLGTDAGLVLWTGERWRRFDNNNGLVWNDCNQNALAEDAAPAIWVGTGGGSSRIAEPERLIERTPLALHLAQARFELEAVVRERTRDLAESHERMRDLALTDSLTGAMNRRAILDFATRELARLRRHGGALTLVLLDLDHFKLGAVTVFDGEAATFESLIARADAALYRAKGLDRNRVERADA